jgi:hypothetical protein
MNLWAVVVQKEMYQKWNIAHPSQISIQVCDHIVYELILKHLFQLLQDPIIWAIILLQECYIVLSN